MGLREEIEAAFGEAAAEGGVRVLAIDGDDEVWVAGLGATDGTLEVRVGDRGPRRGLRRGGPTRARCRPWAFATASTTRGSCRSRRHRTGGARRGRRVSALVDGLGVRRRKRGGVFTQRGARTWSRRSTRWRAERRRSPSCLGSQGPTRWTWWPSAIGSGWRCCGPATIRSSCRGSNSTATRSCPGARSSPTRPSPPPDRPRRARHRRGRSPPHPSRRLIVRASGLAVPDVDLLDGERGAQAGYGEGARARVVADVAGLARPVAEHREAVVACAKGVRRHRCREAARPRCRRSSDAPRRRGAASRSRSGR